MDAMARILAVLLSAYSLLYGMYQSMPHTAVLLEPGLMLVSRVHPLSSTYVPELITANVPPNKESNRAYMKLTPDAARALEIMFQAAKEAGMTLYGVSGYRSYAAQSSLYRRRLEEAGEAHVDLYIAPPGASEHQTGLAMDVLGASTLKDGLEETFADSPEGKWVENNAHRFGFIIRYPKGGEDITGYAWEPWHLRYVGPTHAFAIHQAGITLEEYLVRLQIDALERLIEEKGFSALMPP